MQQPNRVDGRAPYRECNHEGGQEECAKWAKEEAHISTKWGDASGYRGMEDMSGASPLVLL